MSELKSNTTVRMGSERSFGLVFAGVFAIIALLPLLGGSGPRLWALGIGALFAVLGLVKPDVLRPLNRLWFRFGMLLSRIVSPIVMGILFIVTVTPTGLIMRALGKDPLRKSMEPEAESYWIPVDREKAAQTSMRNQF